MKIELKNIKHFEAGSHETECFVADLYVKGFKTAYVENDGHGGCNYITPFPTEKARRFLQEANDYARSLPPIKYPDLSMEIKMDLDCLIDDLLEDFLNKKLEKKNQAMIKKKMVNNLVVQKREGEIELTFWKGHSIDSMLKSPAGREVLLNAVNKAKAAGYTILNTNLSGLI